MKIQMVEEVVGEVTPSGGSSGLMVWGAASICITQVKFSSSLTLLSIIHSLVEEQVQALG